MQYLLHEKEKEVIFLTVINIFLALNNNDLKNFKEIWHKDKLNM